MNFSPELLRLTDGTPVASAEQWQRRRAELLDILRSEVYGVSPPAPHRVSAEIVSETSVFGRGHAVRQQISVGFDTDNGPFSFPVRLFLPRAQKAVPMFLLLSFDADAHDIMYCPAEDIIDNGFALAIIYYNDVTADTPNMRDGLAGMYSLEKYSWGKIGMWAWAASRALDYLTTREEIDSANVAVIGHSRLGKTALWCAAQDERFRFGISNNSGSGGAAYNHAKTEGNEMIGDSVRIFPYWYCNRYSQWAGRDHEVPFDQHFLLAAIAPRCVCVGSAQEDLWAGPYQEQLSCIGASPAWELLGASGYVGKTEPAIADERFFDGNIGYCKRGGIHFLGKSDWLSYIDFIKKHLK